MSHTTGTLLTTDGLQLFTRTWLPDAEPRAAILLVHGINEHSGRYANMAAHLLEQGITVYAYDHRGHGQSAGLRVYVDSFDQYVEDLATVAAHVRAEARNLPLFLIGHSLGGLVASLYLVKHRPEFRGVVLSSPALQIPSDLSPFKQKIVGLVSLIAPRLFMGRLEIGQISRDVKVQEAYLADPLTNNRGIRARVGDEVLRATKRIRENSGAFSMPLYLFHGTADRITDPDGSRWLYQVAPSADKSLKLYEGLLHETMNEPESETVLADLSAWMLERS